MMETVKMIGTSICVTMIVTAIFSMLVPDNKPEKLLKFSISLFFLTGLISPFVGKSISFYIDPVPQNSAHQEQVLESQIEASFATVAKARLEEQVREALKNKGIVPIKITISVHINEQSGISMEQPIIITDEATYAKSGEITQIVSALLGQEPQILQNSRKGESE